MLLKGDSWFGVPLSQLTAPATDAHAKRVCERMHCGAECTRYKRDNSHF